MYLQKNCLSTQTLSWYNWPSSFWIVLACYTTMTLDTNCTHTLWNTHTITIFQNFGTAEAEWNPFDNVIYFGPHVRPSVLRPIGITQCFDYERNFSVQWNLTHFGNIVEVISFIVDEYPMNFNVNWWNFFFVMIFGTHRGFVSFIRFGEYASNAGLSQEVSHLNVPDSDYIVVPERLRGRHFSILGLQHPSALNATCPFFILANAFTHPSSGSATDGFLGLDCR